MKKEDLKGFENKEVKLVLKNDYLYTGKILKLSEDCLMLRDKYGEDILISYDNIKFVRENTQQKKIKSGWIKIILVRVCFLMKQLLILKKR